METVGSILKEVLNYEPTGMISKKDRDYIVDAIGRIDAAYRADRQFGIDLCNHCENGSLKAENDRLRSALKHVLDVKGTVTITLADVSDVMNYRSKVGKVALECMVAVADAQRIYSRGLVGETASQACEKDDVCHEHKERCPMIERWRSAIDKACSEGVSMLIGDEDGKVNGNV